MKVRSREAEAEAHWAEILERAVVRPLTDELADAHVDQTRTLPIRYARRQAGRGRAPVGMVFSTKVDPLLYHTRRAHPTAAEIDENSPSPRPIPPIARRVKYTIQRVDYQGLLQACRVVSRIPSSHTLPLHFFHPHIHPISIHCHTHSHFTVLVVAASHFSLILSTLRNGTYYLRLIFLRVLSLAVYLSRSSLLHRLHQYLLTPPPRPPSHFSPTVPPYLRTEFRIPNSAFTSILSSISIFFNAICSYADTYTP
ncbi:hypothetical protein EVG20_g11134 [Dentipellis fragilis]|uniref:Uncharacterized protein n=1 Tax=Dentipellis fragilis TaxID=205917 RepID=A0A4Y9XP58_9AGAM|nr:hypothetical protein EVG20_g11134 [Dentipellis fragilis]